MSSSSLESPAVGVDLDGTVLDAEPRQVELMASLVDDPDLAGAVRAGFWRLKRDGANSEAAMLRLGAEPARAAELARLWTEEVEEERWLALDRPLPGAVASLRDAAAAGVRLTVLTARRNPDRVRAQLEALDLGSWCARLEVVSPAAAAAEKAARLERLDCRAYVGDTESDGEAAARAGVEFAAVATGQRSASFLRERGFEPFESLAAAFAALLSCDPPA
jgi:phosphoglycolate phosphatase-like HAD superfamily hydrolase